MNGRTIRTPEKRDRLFAKLRRGYSVSAACKAAGIGRTAYYEWREADPEFASEADDAIETGTDVLEDVARTRATRSSDTLLIFLLKARRPEKFRERHAVDINLVIRQKAEKLAEQIGIPVDELIAEAEAVATGAWDSWSPQ